MLGKDVDLAPVRAKLIGATVGVEQAAVSGCVDALCLWGTIVARCRVVTLCTTHLTVLRVSEDHVPQQTLQPKVVVHLHSSAAAEDSSHEHDNNTACITLSHVSHVKLCALWPSQ